MKKLLAGLFLFLLAVSAPLFAAEAMKPIAYVSAKNYQALTDTASVIANELGYKEMFDTMLMLLGQTEGVDETKPAGFVAMTDQSQLVAFGFVPIADLSNFTFPKADAIKDCYDPATKKLTFGDDSDAAVFSVLSRGPYSVIVQEGKEDLVPDSDPTALLDDVREDCALCAKVFPTRVPQAMIESVMTMILTQVADDSDESEAVENQAEALLTFLKQLDEFGFGLKADQSSGDFVLAYDCKAAEGTELEGIFKKMKGRQTAWGELFRPDDDILSILNNSIQSESMIERSRQSIQEAFSGLIDGLLGDDDVQEDDKKTAEEALNKFASFLDKTASQEMTDGVLSLTTDPLLIVAGTIDGGDDLIDAIGTLGEMLNDKAQDEDAADILKKVKFNKSYKGYSVSTFAFKKGECEGLTEFNPDLAGVTPSVLLGVKNDTLILIAGLEQAKVSAKFKEIIALDSKMSDVGPLNFRLSMKNLGACALGLIPEDSQEIYAIADLLNQADPEAAIYETVNYDGSTTCQGDIVITGEFFAQVGAILQSFQSSDDEDEDWGLEDEDEEGSDNN
ncbi:MAG: hypothetical protein IJH68_02020 [Thermoguttaceae bacterium]|nr:hypothetical protein [Thermoguttaceae bacterium]MBQ6618908.1 hypothetical protein [Thermoguttaceae bacterium]